MQLRTIFRRAKRAFFDPRHSFELLMMKTSHFWSDETYIKLVFWARIGYLPNFKSPKTFNEKLQWLKLYGHKPIYSIMADKFKVKSFVADRIGQEYVVPCYGVWKNAEEIDLNSLPNQFVLKCNHNSGGGMVICKDKSSLDFEKCKEELNKCLKQGYYWQGRDKQYRDIDKRIIADMYLDDGRPSELQDYKFWCFDGRPLYMYITNKGSQIFENFYDMDFNPVMVNHGFPRFVPEYEKPKDFDKMKMLAAELSKGIPFIRVDFFYVNGHIYFGEYTFFDWGGLRPFKDNWDECLGQLISIPN